MVYTDILLRFLELGTLLQNVDVVSNNVFHANPLTRTQVINNYDSTCTTNSAIDHVNIKTGAALSRKL